MAEDNQGTDLFWHIFALSIVIALVVGSPRGVSGVLWALLATVVILLLIRAVLWVGSIWSQVERDKIKVQALKNSLEEDTIEGYGKRKWQQLVEQEDEIIQRLDEKLKGWSGLSLFIYRKLGGDGTLQLYTAGAEELDWAKYYVANEGEYHDRVREEKQEAELLEYRQKLARRLNLSADSEQESNEMTEGLRPERQEAEEPSTKEAGDGS